MIRLKLLMPILLVALIVVSCATAPPPEPNGETKKEIVARESPTRETAPPATSIDKVVIGVLDFEVGGGFSSGRSYLEPKKAVMRDLKQNPRVKVVDIHESCSLSDLRRYGYERAERYKDFYQLDMILHVRAVAYPGHQIYFSLMDLYTKKVKEVSVELGGFSAELGLRGISRKIQVSQDLNGVLRAKKKVLGKQEVAASREVKEPSKRATKEITPPATSIDKVVIGVLDIELSGPWPAGEVKLMKKGLMGDLKRDTRVKLVDIGDSCTLLDLKKHGYEHAERHKNIYQLDMILHVQMAGIFPPENDDPVGWLVYFSLMDLYTKKVKEVSIETMYIAGELLFRGISRKILVSQDLNRVLGAKKEYLGKTR